MIQIQIATCLTVGSYGDSVHPEDTARCIDMLRNKCQALGTKRSDVTGELLKRNALQVTAMRSHAARFFDRTLTASLNTHFPGQDQKKVVLSSSEMELIFHELERAIHKEYREPGTTPEDMLSAVRMGRHESVESYNSRFKDCLDIWEAAEKPNDRTCVHIYVKNLSKQLHNALINHGKTVLDMNLSDVMDLAEKSYENTRGLYGVLSRGRQHRDYDDFDEYDEPSHSDRRRSRSRPGRADHSRSERTAATATTSSCPNPPAVSNADLLAELQRHGTQMQEMVAGVKSLVTQFEKMNTKPADAGTAQFNRGGSNAYRNARPRDMSHVKCYECGEKGRYSSNCPKFIDKV